MRRTGVILILSIAAATASSGGASPLPPPTVPCEVAVGRQRVLSEKDRTALGRVAFPGARIFQIAKTSGPLRYWSKVPLFVRDGGTRVTIVVPRGWRSRAAVNWSSGWAPLLHVAACPSPRGVWNVYAGGFRVRAPACVPLLMRVGDWRATVRFGIGAACS